MPKKHKKVQKSVFTGLGANAETQMRNADPAQSSILTGNAEDGSNIINEDIPPTAAPSSSLLLFTDSDSSFFTDKRMK